MSCTQLSVFIEPAPLTTSDGIPPADRDQDHTLMKELVLSRAYLFNSWSNLCYSLDDDLPSSPVVIELLPVAPSVVYTHSTPCVVRSSGIAVVLRGGPNHVK